MDRSDTLSCFEDAVQGRVDETYGMTDYWTGEQSRCQVSFNFENERLGSKETDPNKISVSMIWVPDTNVIKYDKTDSPVERACKQFVVPEGVAENVLQLSRSMCPNAEFQINLDSGMS